MLGYVPKLFAGVYGTSTEMGKTVVIWWQQKNTTHKNGNNIKIQVTKTAPGETGGVAQMTTITQYPQHTH